MTTYINSYNSGKPYRYNNMAISGGIQLVSASKQTVVDTLMGGNGTLTGTINLKGPPLTPVSKRIIIIDNLTGSIAAVTYSDSSGNWSVNNLDKTRYYTAINTDEILNKPAAIDLISPI